MISIPVEGELSSIRAEKFWHESWGNEHAPGLRTEHHIGGIDFDSELLPWVRISSILSIGDTVSPTLAEPIRLY
jgi:hypothetical protein